MLFSGVYRSSKKVKCQKFKCFKEEHKIDGMMMMTKAFLKSTNGKTTKQPLVLESLS